MNHPTEEATTARPWYDIAPLPEPGKATVENLRAHFATMGCAHSRAYHDVYRAWADARETMTRAEGGVMLREAIRAYAFPMAAAFAAAAALSGLTPNQIAEELADGNGTVEELLCQWSGVDWDSIASAALPLEPDAPAPQAETLPGMETAVMA